jgi:hypothetical protein
MGNTGDPGNVDMTITGKLQPRGVERAASGRMVVFAALWVWLKPVLSCQNSKIILICALNN